MSPKDLRDLFLLAAIWGSSFLFMLKAAPAFGPFPMTLVRVGVSGLALLVYISLNGHLRSLLNNWRNIFIVGVLNAAIPFSLYAYAALRLESSLLSVLNAMAPMFTALIARCWLGEQLTKARLLGLFIGFLGILLLVYDKLSFERGALGWAVLAALTATIFYGIAANFSARYLKQVEPQAVAAGSMLGAAALLVIPALYTWPTHTIDLASWGYALSLSLFCTAIAYVIFYRLMANVGPAKTITVTFLVPPFGVFWGILLLGETLNLQVFIGTCTVLVGTLLATGFIGSKKT